MIRAAIVEKNCQYDQYDIISVMHLNKSISVKSQCGIIQGVCHILSQERKVLFKFYNISLLNTIKILEYTRDLLL